MGFLNSDQTLKLLQRLLDALLGEHDCRISSKFIFNYRYFGILFV